MIRLVQILVGFLKFWYSNEINTSCIYACFVNILCIFWFNISPTSIDFFPYIFSLILETPVSLSSYFSIPRSTSHLFMLTIRACSFGGRVVSRRQTFSITLAWNCLVHPTHEFFLQNGNNFRRTSYT
ncbi:hypothetical protein AMTRI_Chr08g163610 [Amborella trichopoda]